GVLGGHDAPPVSVDDHHSIITVPETDEADHESVRSHRARFTMATEKTVSKLAWRPDRESARLTRLRQQIQWLWHSWRGPSARKIAEARSALAGRDYYELYEDVYRQVQEAGGSPERDAEQQRYWAVMYK